MSSSVEQRECNVVNLLLFAVRVRPRRALHRECEGDITIACCRRHAVDDCGKLM